MSYQQDCSKNVTIFKAAHAIVLLINPGRVANTGGLEYTNSTRTFDLEDAQILSRSDRCAGADSPIDFLRELAGLNVIAVDINTVSPPHDVNDMAAFLAAHLAYECLLLLAPASTASCP